MRKVIVNIWHKWLSILLKYATLGDAMQHAMLSLQDAESVSLMSKEFDKARDGHNKIWSKLQEYLGRTVVEVQPLSQFSAGRSDSLHLPKLKVEASTTAPSLIHQLLDKVRQFEEDPILQQKFGYQALKKNDYVTATQKSKGGSELLMAYNLQVVVDL
jgi:hypothetical protein